MDTYEKKYNEAMLRADEAVQKGCLDKDVFDIIFPPEESEDERIRKLLVWQVYRNIEDETNDLAQSVYDGIKGHDPDLEESIEDWKKCLAYLEKQKELPFVKDVMLGYPGLYFYDGERMHFRGPAMEEKQKWPKELPLMGGNADLYFDEWNQQKQNPTKRQCFEEGMRYAQRLQKEQKPVRTAKEAWKEMRLEVYAQASGNRHEPNYSDDSTKMFSLCDIDEIFEKIGDSAVGSQPAELSEQDVPSREMILAIWELGNEWKERPVPESSQLKFIQDHWKESSYFNKLKRLRPSWKPSKEQINALKVVARGYPSDDLDAIESLLNDLKKLL